MQVPFEFPDTISLTQCDYHYLKEVLVTTLYHLGKLSEKEACVALGVTRRAFEEPLPQFGFCVLVMLKQTLTLNCAHAGTARDVRSQIACGRGGLVSMRQSSALDIHTGKRYFDHVNAYTILRMNFYACCHCNINNHCHH